MVKRGGSHAWSWAAAESPEQGPTSLWQKGETVGCNQL